ncbi:MAG TPA: hypothetical protein VIA63_05545 [Candidatus Limnocylindria bacterium]
MRFAIVVLGAAMVQVFPYLRLDQWIGIGAVLAMAYIALAALGAGFFAVRRPALAGALSVLLGALLYVVVITAIQPGGDPGAFTFFLLRIPIAVFPFIVAGAIAGWIGGRIRARAIAAPR